MAGPRTVRAALHDGLKQTGDRLARKTRPLTGRQKPESAVNGLVHPHTTPNTDFAKPHTTVR